MSFLALLVIVLALGGIFLPGSSWMPTANGKPPVPDFNSAKFWINFSFTIVAIVLAIAVLV